MPQDPELQMLLQRVERTLQQKSVDSILNKVRAIIGPANMPATEQGRLAQEALDQMRVLKRPTPPQLMALEYVIRLMRPAPLSRSGVLDKMRPEFSEPFPNWDVFRESVRTSLYSIGRIDSLTTRKSVGTGFLVREHLLLTNRHVLDELSGGIDELEKGQAAVYFGQEYGTPDARGMTPILRVVAIHESLDMALLEIEQAGTGESRTALTIATTPAQQGEAVVAIGYPFDDPVRNPMFINALFGGKFGVKRAAPGEVLKAGNEAFFHDCSTLGGNSGSPILSMTTAQVVGLHSDGFFMYRNEAIHAGSVNHFVQHHA